VTKCFRAETRTDCEARMTLTLDRGEGKYEITDVVLEHNHLFQLPETCHLWHHKEKFQNCKLLKLRPLILELGQKLHMS
jgi:hypothetical protein